MNWLVEVLQKEGRRYRTNDRVRYFVNSTKGKGKGLVHTPPMARGHVQDWDSVNRRYKVMHDDGSRADVHPRNIVPETVSRSVPDVII